MDTEEKERLVQPINDDSGEEETLTAAENYFGDSPRICLVSTERLAPPPRSRAKLLGTLGGVICPVALAQFSTTLFLRVGYVVGQSGLLEALLQFVLAYGILTFTVLSICAISTNGAVEGGGAYYMISRVLGPEFGGSIGLLFFLANVFSCGVYVSGFVEGFEDVVATTLGSPTSDCNGPSSANSGPLPTGYWFTYMYASAVLFICLIVCMIGGSMFAKTSAFILLVVTVCIISVIVSFIGMGELSVPIPHSNHLVYRNKSLCEEILNATYTGINKHTFTNNLGDGYTKDYTQDGKSLGFATVFAVLFSGVTGIMNGANMSGELKNPSKSIPKGTLIGVGYTFVVYIILTCLTSATSSRRLLHTNYSFLQSVNYVPVFVYIGIFAATLSAALGNLIGASRVLEALAKDDVFWIFTRPALKTSANGNPWVAVLMSWFLVQLVLLIGAMNTIAPMTSIFFLLSYAACNLACLALDLASAPNFRPSFRYYHWSTCSLGLCGCLVMAFLIGYVYAIIALIVTFILVFVLYFRSMSVGWGHIGQALIFHQVRKYLLMLDSRKDHIKFWRPQMLLLVANPRSCAPLIGFINDLKKSGLYVLGHVYPGSLEDCPRDPVVRETHKWLELVDFLKVKAFVEITQAPTVKEGMQQLVRLAGLGGMKPNTVCFGFYDGEKPVDTFQLLNRKTRMGLGPVEPLSPPVTLGDSFSHLRCGESPRHLSGPDEYVGMMRDVIGKMEKNLCLFRNFATFDREAAFENKMYVDVWPVNVFKPDGAHYIDNCCLFMLQLACILHMVPRWKTKTRLRVHLCIKGTRDDSEKRKRKLTTILDDLRISAEIRLINWEHAIDEHYPAEHRGVLDPTGMPIVPVDYTKQITTLIERESYNTSVVFLYLPTPPDSPSQYPLYLEQLTTLTESLPPTVLVHGLKPVTSTSL